MRTGNDEVSQFPPLPVGPHSLSSLLISYDMVARALAGVLFSAAAGWADDCTWIAQP